MFATNTLIQKKLMKVILMTTGVSLLIACFGFIAYEIYIIQKNMGRAVDARAEMIASTVATTHALHDPLEMTGVLSALERDPRILGACIYDATGKIVSHYPVNAAPASFPNTPGPIGHVFSPNTLIGVTPIISHGQTVGMVYLKSNLTALTDRYPGYAALTAIVLVASLLAAYLISTVLQQQFLQPIESLANTARTVSKHRDYSVRAAKYSNDELGLLTDTFNEMLGRIQDQNQVLQQFAAIIESSEDAIIGNTLEGIITSWNPGAEKVFGYMAAEMIGSSILRLVPETRQKEEREILEKMAKGINPDRYETDRQAKDGRLIHIFVTNSLIKNLHGKIVGASLIARDISEHRRAEDQLRKSYKEITDLKAALDEHAIVAITDPQGKITYVNDKFCAISKYSREELLGQDHRIINSSHHPKEFIRNLWKTISHGKVWHGEIKNRAKDNSHYWVSTTIVPFLDEDGKPRQYVAIRADITERKRAEAEVLQLNAELEKRVTKRTEELEATNRDLEAFSYSISHDLRAPLRSINGFAGFIMEDYSSYLPEEAQNYLERVCKGSQRMGDLIDDLLSFARLGRRQLTRQNVEMSRLVREVLEELNPRENGRQIELIQGELPDCSADPALLKQVWSNLLSNALKYSRNSKPAIVEIGHLDQEGASVYFVRDNGTGFDMQFSSKLFGVFQRLHRAEEYEGTGVGLAIVQRIVQRHGGRVWAHAEVNKGATFYFTLTATEKEARAV